MCIAPTKGMEGVHSQHKCTLEVTQDTEYNDAGPAAFAVQLPGHHCTVWLQMYILQSVSWNHLTGFKADMNPSHCDLDNNEVGNKIEENVATFFTFTYIDQ